MAISKEDHRLITAKLAEKGAVKCPACGAELSGAQDGFFTPAMVNNKYELTDASIEKPMVPCIGVACHNCGHLRFHKLGPLGLDHLFK